MWSLVCDFLTYLLALFSHWRVLMSAGILWLISVLRFFLPQKGEQVTRALQPWRIPILLLAIFLAGFLAWQDEHIVATTKTKSQKIVREIEKTVREPIHQLHGDNKILLTYDPIPDSVRVHITGVAYFVFNTQGLRLDGRNIYAEDIPGDVPFLTIIREEAPRGNVIVEYQQRLTEEEVQEIQQ